MKSNQYEWPEVNPVNSCRDNNKQYFHMAAIRHCCGCCWRCRHRRCSPHATRQTFFSIYNNNIPMYVAIDAK